MSHACTSPCVRTSRSCCRTRSLGRTAWTKLVQYARPLYCKALQHNTTQCSILNNCNTLQRTTDASWHGMPDPVKCPEGRARQSVAIYYMSDARPESTLRFKASFRPRPGSLDPAGLFLSLTPKLFRSYWLDLSHTLSRALTTTLSLARHDLLPPWRPLPHSLRFFKSHWSVSIPLTHTRSRSLSN